MMTKHFGSGLAVLVALALMTPARAQEKKEALGETFSALAMVPGNTGTAGKKTVRMFITRWSTDAERELLLTTLAEKGQEDFITALHNQKEAGVIRIMGKGAADAQSPSMGLRYAREFRDDKGNRTIVLALDQSIAIAEGTPNRGRRDLDLTLILLNVDSTGKGEGQLSAGVRVTIDKDKKELAVEYDSTEPIALTNVKRES